MPTIRRLAAACLAAFVAALALTAADSSGSTVHAAGARPNIVFVLTDDLSWNLLQYMPHVQQLERQGMTFDNYFVTDSLCCPSRSSIFTGRFPHDTGVYSNTGPNGGIEAFNARGDESDTFATELQAQGYDTAMMGKYLNGYKPDSSPIPPGWNEWDVAGDGYPEFNYTLNENRTPVHYGHRPQDYLTDVLAGRGASFIDQAASSGSPFMLELATFAPHSPYTPAPRYATAFQGLQAPRTPAFNAPTAGAARWLAGQQPLRGAQIRAIDEAFRNRVRSAQSVDDMLATIEAELEARGVAQNTYIVFSSDNGLHMGEHRLMPGKMTAFDTDVRVPLIVSGPGVAAGSHVARLAENIDLCPTFEQLGGAPVPATVDGRSLVDLLHGNPVGGWRNAVLIEHRHPAHSSADPDLAARHSGNPATYEALRTANGLYVAYANGEREYYDLANDPYELTNVFSLLSPARVASLDAEVRAIDGCHDGATCSAAEQAQPELASIARVRRGRAHVTRARDGSRHRRRRLPVVRLSL